MISRPVLAMFAATAALTIHTSSSQAQVLPTPIELVSGLDLECFKTPGPAINQNINLTHLNPVLVGLGLPAHQVVLRELQQTCVPVRKNNSGPSAAALPFIRYIDFACYRVDAQPLPNPVPLGLTHLNPVLANLPQHGVRLTRPAQLCVPIAKNNQMPPDNILQFARYVDLECWDTIPDQHPAFTLTLHQLNPLLANIPAHQLALGSPQRQLCVPVRKNNQAIPATVLSTLRWIDLEKFTAAPAAVIAPVNLMLRHLNPLFVNLPQVPVVLKDATHLMVPVAKNGNLPPAD